LGMRAAPPPQKFQRVPPPPPGPTPTPPQKIPIPSVGGSRNIVLNCTMTN